MSTISGSSSTRGSGVGDAWPIWDLPISSTCAMRTELSPYACFSMRDDLVAIPTKPSPFAVSPMICFMRLNHTHVEPLPPVCSFGRFFLRRYFAFNFSILSLIWVFARRSSANICLVCSIRMRVQWQAVNNPMLQCIHYVLYKSNMFAMAASLHLPPGWTFTPPNAGFFLPTYFLGWTPGPTTGGGAPKHWDEPPRQRWAKSHLQ